MEVRTRGRAKERALRGVGVETRSKGNEELKAGKVGEEEHEEQGTRVRDDEDEDVDSPRKRQRVGDSGESVAVARPQSSRKSALGRTSAGRIAGSSSKLPAKRPIEEVSSGSEPRILSRPVSKPPFHRTQAPVSKKDHPRASGGSTRTRIPPPVQGSAPISKSVFPKSSTSGPRNITNT